MQSVTAPRPRVKPRRSRTAARNGPADWRAAQLDCLTSPRAARTLTGLWAAEVCAQRPSLLADPEKRMAPALGTVQADVQPARLTRIKPSLFPPHVPHALQQPTRHVLQTTEQLPHRTACLLRQPPQQAAPFQ